MPITLSLGNRRQLNENQSNEGPQGKIKFKAENLSFFLNTKSPPEKISKNCTKFIESQHVKGLMNFFKEKYMKSQPQNQFHSTN